MRHLYKVLLITVLFCWNYAFGQQRLLLDFKANIGSSGLEFNRSQNQLENTSKIFNANWINAGIQYRIGKYIGLGFSVFDQANKWSFRDSQGISLNNGDYIKPKIQSSLHIQGFSGNIALYVPIKERNSVNWIFASGYNYGKIKPISGASEFNYHTSEITVVQNISLKEYSAIYLESGFHLSLGKRFGLTTCMGLNYNLNPVYDCTYTLETNNISGSTPIKSRAVNFYLGTSLTYSLFEFKKREKKKPYIPEYDEKNKVIAIDGRKVDPQHSLTVKNTSVQIQVWDYGIEDGDKISLFINDIRILRKYTLTHKKKQIQVNLNPGLNKLIVFAHNLGKDPPNTASVVIYDGDEKHVLSLESTLGRCGAIEIYCGE